MKKSLWPTIKSFQHQATTDLTNMLLDNAYLQKTSKIRLPNDINDFGRYTLGFRVSKKEVMGEHEGIYKELLETKGSTAQIKDKFMNPKKMGVVS